jgi:hypothetical protein
VILNHRYLIYSEYRLQAAGSGMLQQECYKNSRRVFNFNSTLGISRPNVETE